MANANADRIKMSNLIFFIFGLLTTILAENSCVEDKFTVMKIFPKLGESKKIQKPEGKKQC